LSEIQLRRFTSVSESRDDSGVSAGKRNRNAEFEYLGEKSAGSSARPHVHHVLITVFLDPCWL